MGRARRDGAAPCGGACRRLAPGAHACRRHAAHGRRRPGGDRSLSRRARPGPGARPVSVALTIRGLAAGYGGFRVLDGLDLELTPQRITAIVGPNGAGKSTLLKALAGLLPREGTVT